MIRLITQMMKYTIEKKHMFAIFFTHNELSIITCRKVYRGELLFAREESVVGEYIFVGKAYHRLLCPGLPGSIRS